MLLLIDNYDSFVHNLARYFRILGEEVCVLRNDAVTATSIAQLPISHIVLSPGPGRPEDAGNCLAIAEHWLGMIPFLGVCLGHQILGQVLGASVKKAQKPLHGQASLIHHQGTGIFQGLPTPLQVGRYHSLIVSSENQTPAFSVTSVSEEGEIMSFCNEALQVVGVQFHPESILTEYGSELLANFLQSYSNKQASP